MIVLGRPGQYDFPVTGSVKWSLWLRKGRK